ncbi:hypothetical protein SAMN05892883_2723 [Jatrophihabitans sp. GAS493]|uniref:hypothetical protein n=1 Tax=Jatrophihabitans sp. GAS493 TaxID=1907575 RepID=UPI000BB800CD|nr:hypothetical protein [Jatrophihabitans sp. GAS493]SOD73431.1 hypothetical protein SAMN05892883_2723 [Jatrophihabitans sp. GAS493]
MSDQALRRADELLTELVEIVETARAVPMSSSCVIGREHVLDILDDLRDVMPPEMAEARRVVAQRDDLLRSATETEALARSQSEQLVRDSREAAERAADQIVADARTQAEQLLTIAQQQAYELVESGRAEHGRLVSATSVHHAAAEQAEQLRAETTAEAKAVRRQAQVEASDIRSDAERASRTMRLESDGYADRTLVDLIEVLRKAAVTAEQGRRALAARRDTPPPVGSEPASVADPAAPTVAPTVAPSTADAPAESDAPVTQPAADATASADDLPGRAEPATEK